MKRKIRPAEEEMGNVVFLIGVEMACLVLQYGSMILVDVFGSINHLLIKFLCS